MTEPQRATESASDCFTQAMDRSLAFWEQGPIREIVEMEFALALLKQTRKRGIGIDRETERHLHDAVLPEVVLFLVENVRWSPKEERRKRFTRAHQDILRQEMNRGLGAALAGLDDIQHEARRLAFPFTHHLAIAFGKLPEAVKEFFSP